jgi:hypothetical protein
MPGLKVTALLEPQPGRWGLRGDPHLWEALRLHLAEEDMPDTVDAVMRLVHGAFGELTGVDLASDHEEMVYREQYAHGGMSSGWISLTTWREDLMPLIAARAAAVVRRAPDGPGGAAAP